ncbi:AbfB domain-containing protein [Streptomyces sp. TG1A-8]|uniref:AbfB domain-containing protein n=1 Tax=Streptomyces sp. TG1A-8 TaxID=3051385 RepID=UPI00265C1382|nr:AbfB domain-containing protein [Streptomyces sp. TG1A-8]MDO0927948.1 AbfB domain-containing protein [Streptomyces sp. TG1A-8]
MSPVTSGSPSLDKGDATWIVRRGLADGSCVCLEPRNHPGDFLGHFDHRLHRQPMDGTARFRADATFCPQTGRSGTDTSSASYDYPTRHLRHYDHGVHLAGNGGSTSGTAAPPGPPT